MKNSRFTNNSLHLGASGLETGRVTIPKIITHLYLVPRIIVFKNRKDPSFRTYVISWKPFLSTDVQRQCHKIIWQQFFCGHIKTANNSDLK